MKRRMRFAAAVLGVLVLAGSACSSDEGAVSPDPTSATTSSTSSTPGTGTTDDSIPPELGCPTDEEYDELLAIRTEFLDGPADSEDVDNAKRQVDIFEPYVPPRWQDFLDDHRSRLADAVEKAEGIDLYKATHEPESLTDDEYNRVEPFYVVAADPTYEQVAIYFFKACGERATF